MKIAGILSITIIPKLLTLFTKERSPHPIRSPAAPKRMYIECYNKPKIVDVVHALIFKALNIAVRILQTAVGSKPFTTADPPPKKTLHLAMNGIDFYHIFIIFKDRA